MISIHKELLQKKIASILNNDFDKYTVYPSYGGTLLIQIYFDKNFNIIKNIKHFKYRVLLDANKFEFVEKTIITMEDYHPFSREDIIFSTKDPDFIDDLLTIAVNKVKERDNKLQKEQEIQQKKEEARKLQILEKFLSV